MEPQFIEYKNSRIRYYRFGTGPEIAVCFHGYGEDGMLYKFLEDHVGHLYTFYAMDLPFHGQTIWNDGLSFTHADLSDIVNAMLNRYPLTGNSQFTVLGFSLGGRIALSLYQVQPGAIKKMILLAPDGLKINFWYWLATQNYLGNQLFAYSMKRPGWFFALLKLLNKMGWVNASIFKFVNFYIGNANARDLLFQRWTGLKKLKPDIAKIKTLIRQHKMPVRLVYGKYDRIILPAPGEKFRAGIEDFCQLTVIDSGHQVVHPNHVAQLLPILSD